MQLHNIFPVTRSRAVDFSRLRETDLSEVVTHGQSQIDFHMSERLLKPAGGSQRRTPQSRMRRANDAN
jgi:hypothetical protein